MGQFKSKSFLHWVSQIGLLFCSGKVLTTALSTKKVRKTPVDAREVWLEQSRVIAVVLWFESARRFHAG